MKTSAGMILCWLILGPVYALGFDCTKVRSNVEVMICKDEGLWTADQELAKRYQYALSLAKDKQDLINDQRKWLGEVRNACKDEECLAEAYGERNRVLAELFPYPLGTVDCAFPSRTTSLGWIYAGNGGSWVRSIPGAPLRSAKGFFRFIYFSKTPTKEGRLYVEAWEQLPLDQRAIWVGCIEINDPEIAGSDQLVNFKFRESSKPRTSPYDGEIFLDFGIFVGRNRGLTDLKPTPHSVKIPFSFINVVD